MKEDLRGIKHRSLFAGLTLVVFLLLGGATGAIAAPADPSPSGALSPFFYWLSGETPTNNQYTNTTSLNRGFGLSGAIVSAAGIDIGLVLASGTGEVAYSQNSNKSLAFTSNTAGISFGYDLAGAEAVFTFSYANIKNNITTKNCKYGKCFGTITADVTAEEYAANLDLRYDIRLGWIVARPGVSVFVSSFNQPAYSESGSGGQKIDAQERGNTRIAGEITFLGLPANPEKTPTPFLSYRYSHELDEYTPNGAFSHAIPIAGNSYTVTTKDNLPKNFPSQSSHLVSLGMRFGDHGSPFSSVIAYDYLTSGDMKVDIVYVRVDWRM